MSLVMGLHDGHNASAALLENGRVVAILQEERLTRVKNQGDIPARAAAEILADRADAGNAFPVALNGNYIRHGEWRREAVVASYEGSGGRSAAVKSRLKGTWVDRSYQRRRAAERARALAGAGFAADRQEPVEHHLAHAAAAYYGSGWTEGKTLVLTCDGSGDRLCATVNVGENGVLKRLAAVAEEDSIGRVYSAVTHQLGLLPLEHEYKVMGMAPYVGDAERARPHAGLFSDLFEFTKNPMVWRRRRGVPPMYASGAFFRRLLHRRRFDHLCAGVQLFVEEMLIRWVRNCVQATGVRRVVCGGGVFMNVKANGSLLALPEVEQLFVFPSCGDEGNSLGAAYWAQARRDIAAGRPVSARPVGALYFGRPIDDAGAERLLGALPASEGIRFRREADVERTAAEALAAGEIVARAKGPAEFGARALGNRSILARPDRPEVVRVINEMIKSRDFWMPFAPSVLAERAGDYYVKPKPMTSPYMMMAFPSRPEARAKFPAAMHPYDFTARPQEVTAEHNPDYHRLLKHYEARTGEGIVLNTSFNIHGEPIVHTAADALDVFRRSGLRRMALGNWWVWKE